MWEASFDRVEGAVNVEHGDVLLADRDDGGTPRRDVRHLAHSHPLAHARPSKTQVAEPTRGPVSMLVYQTSRRGGDRRRASRMLQVQVRYRYSDLSAFCRQVSGLGATLAASRTDVDQYFNAPDRDLKATDEAFRLRRVGERNCFTYKGPSGTRKRRLAPRSRSRWVMGMRRQSMPRRCCWPFAIDRWLSSARRGRSIGLRGGFPMEACFDNVERVGAFIELEILAEEDRYEPAKVVLMRQRPSWG